ncbi:helix-turn-helix domain-containing protein [Nocardiopsis sp. CA-288880]|uniref:helix-turn-helix domain-containing protein n=1 Tax=Nocardiopsis sp. CA-288880 TaxID=3239995 RepID=UPI003D957386
MKLNHRPSRVTEARTAAKLTKTELSEKLRCSLSLVSEIESGSRNASPQRLERMAEVLGVEISYLASDAYLAEPEDAA